MTTNVKSEVPFRVATSIFLSLATLSLLLAITAIAYTLHWSFTIDDAAISFSYARNFALGHGLGALYPGAPRVEGYSNLLWVIVLATGTKLGLDTLLVSKILGLAFSLGSMTVLFFCLRDFIRYRWLLLGLALLPISLTFSFWSVSGLENSLYVFLILLSVYFLIREDRDNWFPAGSALSLILVGITRPEGIIYFLAALVYKVVQLAIAFIRISKDQGLAISNQQSQVLAPQVTKRTLIWLAIVLLGYGLFKAWHYWYFAAWWPNPIYAKAGWYKTDLLQIFLAPEGWVYLRGYFRTFAALWLVPALVFGGIVSLVGRQRVFAIFALAALVLPLLTSDWMVNYRFLYPFLPFQVALLILAADQLWFWITNSGAKQINGGAIDLFGAQTSPIQKYSSARKYHSALQVISIGLAVWFGFGVARYTWANLRLTQRQLACGYAPFAEMRCLDGKMYWTMGEVDQKYNELEKFAGQLGLADPLYLIPDIGATSYLQNKRILDLAGLGDYHMARIRDGALLKQYIFEERRPDIVMIYGVWTRRTDLTAFSAFAENYLPIEKGQDADGRINGTFVRKDLVIKDPSSLTEQNGAKEVAPGLFLHLPPEINTTMEVRLRLDTFWETRQPMTKDLSYQIKLSNPAGQIIHEESAPLGYGWYPTSAWQTGDVFRQHIQLPGDLPAGEYTIELSLVSDKEGTTLGRSLPANFQPSTFKLTLALSERVLPQNLPNPNPSARAKELYLAAKEAVKQTPMNWEKAYELYLAAWLADPDNVWAQRGLEYARRMAIL